ncbi:MAG TPA: sigma factor-like helix-turn-helix DNA-binding protein, partial [Candidatus Ozemobacteraceae bacterium]|nr:sigma factor-like helix-turn-helix DNA-binding protein [Candidatus Ozemobacteraceae bacterium]
TRLDVRTVLDRLPSRDRAVLIMAYWDDLTCSEIADVLSTNENHVKILLYRARNRFAGIWNGKPPVAKEETSS